MQKTWISFSLVVLLAMLANMSRVSMASGLQVGFYKNTCPSAEMIVRRVMNKAISQSPGIGAGIIRMHFHDCFVRGCDASILIDSTPGNSAEKENRANNPSLRPVLFDTIDKVKAELESHCPETVSCADIIAFAARDSAQRLGWIDYEVPGGRRDGTISKKDDPTPNLVPPSSNLTTLKENFATKGLSLEELVILSGAHSIGISHCSSFTRRLYSFNSTHPQDPSLDPKLANFLKSKCPNNNANVDPTVFLDFVTPNRLDNQYYRNLQRQRVLFTSDQTLMTSPASAQLVRNFGWNGGVWAKKFGDAMVHMGSIEVLTGAQGQIRKNCRVVN